ncbi:MAG: carboxypeptidase-like regulatory domain-containing protein [Flavobacteriaceae bacterium]|nr:carboxypeptidase-like regulatory domain-containing protein [Flavobacteriaceae bacterium]
MKKIVTTMALCLMVSVLMAQIKVHGTVTDANGKQVAGVIITEKGTKNGVVTDRQGGYELQVPSKETVLEFLFVGVDRIERKCDKNPLNVQLNEVVATNENPNESTIILYNRYGEEIAKKKKINFEKDRPNFADVMNEKEFAELEMGTYFYLIKQGTEQKTGSLKKKKGDTLQKGGKIYSATYRGIDLKNKKVYLDIDGKKTLLQDGMLVKGAKIKLKRRMLKIDGTIPYKEKASLWFGNIEWYLDGTPNIISLKNLKIISGDENDENVIMPKDKQMPNVVFVDKNKKANTSILYVIDGKPTLNQKKIIEISPDSIKNMTVLRGEIGTAVYGEQGKNGVIIITTKKKK